MSKSQRHRSANLLNRNTTCWTGITGASVIYDHFTFLSAINWKSGSFARLRVEAYKGDYCAHVSWCKRLILLFKTYSALIHRAKARYSQVMLKLPIYSHKHKTRPFALTLAHASGHSAPIVWKVRRCRATRAISL